MLFHLTWDYVDTSEEGVAGLLEVFSKWTPAEGTEMKGFYGRADQSGGVAIIEARDALALSRGVAAFQPWVRYEAIPLIQIEESAKIAAEGAAFRTSVAKEQAQVAAGRH